MKKYLALALTLIAFSSLSAKAEDTVIETYILAGQSNADGFGLAFGDLLTGSLEPNQNLESLGRSDLVDSQDSAYIYKGEFNNGIGEWRNLAPGNGVFNGVRFGPELSFSTQFKAFSGKNVAIIKYSPGNTSLNTDWDPNANQTNQYDHFITTVNNAKAAASSVGLSLNISGVLWMQGESDGFSASGARDYEINLTNFIAETRSDLSLPNLKFHIGQIADTPTWAARQQIWSAQEAVTNSDLRAFLVHGQDLPLFIDDGSDGPADVHYSTLGTVSLGERFASSVFYNGTPSFYPQSAADNVTTQKNTSISIDVLRNDDGGGLLLTTVNSWSVKGGTIKIINGKAEYTPRGGFIGTDSFWYVFSDYLGRTNSAKVTVEVTDSALVSAYPQGNPDTGTTSGQAITIDVLANDTGSGLTITFSHPWSLRGGRVVVADNKLNYTPSPNFSGEDKIWYTFEDSQGRTNSAEVTIDAPFPVAVTEAVTVKTNTAKVIDALKNDIGVGLSLSDVNAFSVNGATVAIVKNQLLYTPRSDYVGSDSFWYVVKDFQDRTNAIEVTVRISN